MSDGRKLSELFKSAAEVASISNTDRVLAVDSAGGVKRMKGCVPLTVNLRDKEEAGSEITLFDFIEKYALGLPVGSTLGDFNAYSASAWAVRLSDDISVSTQDYLCRIIKAKGASVHVSWGYFGFVFESHKPGLPTYKVFCDGKATAGEYRVWITKIDDTLVSEALVSAFTRGGGGKTLSPNHLYNKAERRAA